MKKLLTFVTMALMAISANAQGIVAEIDWTQESEWNGMWYSSDYASVSVEQGTGLIIDCSADGTTNYWEPQVPMIGHIPYLDEGGSYQLKFTLNSPVSGELRIDLCSWDGTGATYSDIINVKAGENEYEVDFPDYPTECEDAMVFYQCGKLPGKHIIKNVQVLEYIPVNKEIWTVAGDKVLMGADWDAQKNKMKSLDGEKYTLTMDALSLQIGTYYYKVFKNYATQESYPSSNASLVIDENAVYQVKFTFNSKTKEVSAVATKTGGIKYNFITKGKAAEVIGITSNVKGDVVIPSTVKNNGEEYTVTKICDNAFNNCSRLTSVTIPTSVTTIGNFAFQGCNSLASITIPNSVTSIENYVFSGCSGLKSVSIPNSVTSIGEYAFYNCSKLTSITIPNSVISIGNYAFSSCSGLTSVIIPSSVASIGSYAFQNCSGLTSLTIGKNVISIYENAFSGCNSLESIAVESGNTVYDSRNGCNAIINSEANLLILGCKKTIIPNSITSIGNNAFASCNGLPSVVIPNGVVSIGSNAFSGCKDLTSVTIPNSVTYIGYSAFENCIKLNSISAPNCYVSDNAFYGCSSLTSATFTGASVGNYAFANCPELKDVYYMFDVALYEKDPGFSWYIGYNIFQDSYIEYATLHVPAASLSIYKNAEPWKNFMKVVALSDSDIPETPETPKCAKPTITYNNGVITFSCETEGVEFISEVKANDNKKEYDNKIILSNTYTVSVYATKAGYDNSETVTMEVVGTGGILGDLTGDGKVDVADHVKLSEIIMKQE